MSGIIITALVILAFIVIYQIASANELANALRHDEAELQEKNNKLMAWLMAIVFVVGLLGIYLCDAYMRPLMLPEPASEQGIGIDWLSNLTLIILMVAFLITQFMLFYFIFRFKGKKTRTAHYYPHNNRLEIMWTTIPAIVLAILIVMGLKDWFKITSPAPKNAMTVEIVGKQFNWVIHYPGPDGILGKRDFRLINDATNVLGLDWNDPASHDDIIIENGEMHVVKNVPVNLVINSRDVIHDVGLPYFRMKMDAVPGITTNLWFKPIITTEEMKAKTGNPDFVYEIACDQLCGSGHYSMRGTVVVENQIDFNTWLAGKKSYYAMQHESEGAAPQADSSATKTAAPAVAAVEAH